MPASTALGNHELHSMLGKVDDFLARIKVRDQSPNRKLYFDILGVLAALVAQAVNAAIGFIMI